MKQGLGTTLLLAVLGASVALGWLARAAAGATCALASCTVRAQPLSGLTSLLGGDAPTRAWEAPGMPTVVFWLVWAVEVAVVVTAGVWAWARWGGKRQRRRTDPRRIAGVASTAEVRKHLSASAVRKMVWLRPDLPRPRACDLAVRIGMSRGMWVWIPVEDSVGILAASRGGKGRYFVDPIVAEFPGAVLTTSVRAETAASTVLDRQRRGPVAVFAPSGLDVSGPAGRALAGASVRWSLSRGCEDPETALRRARALAANGGTRGTGSDAFWGSNARLVIAPMLHAAALAGAGVDALARWASRPGLAQEAVSILARDSRAVPGWSTQLESAMKGDDRTVANIWATVRTCISEPLMDPAVREAISPAPGQELDIDDFIDRQGTLYVVGDASASSAPIVAALIEDVFAAAMRRANRSPGNRLTPPLGLVFDEIHNIAVLPSLATMVSAGGGSGVMTIFVEQSRAQAAARLGREAADAIFDAATTKIIAGGITKGDTVNDLSAAAGEREVRRGTVYSGRDSWGTSTSWSEHEERVLTGAQLRELPKGVALVLKGSTPAVIVEGKPLDSRARRRGRPSPQMTTAPTRTACVGPTTVVEEPTAEEKEAI